MKALVNKSLQRLYDASVEAITAIELACVTEESANTLCVCARVCVCDNFDTTTQVGLLEGVADLQLRTRI